LAPAALFLCSSENRKNAGASRLFSTFFFVVHSSILIFKTVRVTASPSRMPDFLHRWPAKRYI
jgi:hypothetical protein